MNLDNILSCVYDVYARCGIRDFPINCFTVLNQYELNTTKYSELSRARKAACLRLSKDACTIEKTIYYEDGNIAERIRFSVMHELGHMLLSTQDEDEADTFSSYILAPRIIIHRKGYRTCDDIHRAFGLSYSASNRALADYYNWFNKICRTTRKPSLPEQQLEHIFYPANSEPYEKKRQRSCEGKKQRSLKGKRELEERGAFMQELQMTQGDAYMLSLAEEQRLYGIHL